MAKASKLRGTASLPIWERKRIASLGGKAAPAETRIYAVDRDLAVSAGRIGGLSVKAENRSFSLDRELAREAGRKGAEARKRKRKNKTVDTV
jgi:general stress protein YciG